MALIRGGNALFPCPMCLVPSDRLTDLSVQWPKRNQKETQKLVDDVLLNTDKGRLRDAAEKLKGQGLRPIKVVFYINVYAYISNYHSRMPSGISNFRIHSRLYHGIGCTITRMALMDTIYGH